MVVVGGRRGQTNTIAKLRFQAEGGLAYMKTIIDLPHRMFWLVGIFQIVDEKCHLDWYT